MTEKEFRRMSRRELVEIIAEQKKTELELRARLGEVEIQLANRSVLASADTVPEEELLPLYPVFDNARKAAEEYLSALRSVCIESDQILNSAREEAKRIIKRAEKESGTIRANPKKPIRLKKPKAK